MEHEMQICRLHSGIETSVAKMEESIKTIESKVDRPPIWLSFVFAGMSFILGSALTWIVHLHSVIRN